MTWRRQNRRQTSGKTLSRFVAFSAVLFSTVLFSTVLIVSCGPASEPPRHAPASAQPVAPPSIILISIDTLRADHLGSYGYSRDTSPVLDKLAQESVRFTAAFAPTPWTLPSHASMLTGMHPYEIGIDNSLRKLPENIPIIAELLTEANYQTAAFVDSSPQGFVGAERGFGRGFEIYRHSPFRPEQVQRFDMAATVDEAVDWLGDRDPSKPFFLFLHTKSVHAVPNEAECLDPRCSPYQKPEPWQFRFIPSDRAPASWTSPEGGAGQRYLWSLNAKILDGELDPAEYPSDRLEQLKAFYDAGIYYVDFHLGRLFADLEQRNLLANSIVVVTSDHGESFLDHSLFMHQEVFDTLLHIPLIVRLPNLSQPRDEERQVVLADILPTLLQQANVPVPDHVTGRPLPLMPSSDADASNTDISDDPRDLFSYYLFPRKFTYQALALRRGDWKLVIHNLEDPARFHRELYNLSGDPEEQLPVTGEAEMTEALRQALRRRLRQTPIAQGSEMLQQDLPNLEAIRTLGYIE